MKNWVYMSTMSNELATSHQIIFSTTWTISFTRFEQKWKQFTVNVPNNNRGFGDVNNSLLFLTIFHDYIDVFTFLSREMFSVSNDVEII
jgi:hypothetical protein